MDIKRQSLEMLPSRYTTVKSFNFITNKYFLLTLSSYQTLIDTFPIDLKSPVKRHKYSVIFKILFPGAKSHDALKHTYDGPKTRSRFFKAVSRTRHP